MLFSCFERLPISYMTFNFISAMAIGDSPAKKLKLCQIYDWIKEKFPYYRVSAALCYC